MDDDEKLRKIEPDVKAPDSIRKKVQATLDTYRLIGDIAGLYIDGMAQTLIGFTDFVKPIGSDFLLEENKNSEEDQSPDKDKEA